MSILGKLEDELFAKIKNAIKSIRDEEKKQNNFSLVWDTIRDEYEIKYGEDNLYDYMWLKNDFMGKIMLAEIRKYPASREFIEKLYLFIQDEMEEDFDNKQCINFITILYKNLICCEEFEDKMIKIRKDWEAGLQLKAVRHFSTLVEEKKNIVDDKIGVQKQSIIDNSDIINMYAKNYTEVMFMQKRQEAQICLKDIYTENDYEVILGTKSSKRLLDYIHEFCKSEINTPILFIEGHAGIGKSSLISRLAYEYLKNGDIAGKKLAIIQLRNLSVLDKKIDVFNPWSDFKRYLHFGETIKKFFSILNDYVVILDGFDELCLLDDIRQKNKLYYITNILKKIEDYQCECKIIITTRPNYLAKKNEWKIIYQNPTVIYLQHFSVNKRKEWIKAVKRAGMKISEAVEKSLVTEMQNDVEAVASTPLTLYLIAHENIIISMSDELWTIYKNIFGKEIMRKRYDHLNIDEEIREHPGNKIFELIYEITKEIAYYMYCNSKIDILWDEITRCIEKVLKRKTLEEYYNKAYNVKKIKSLLKDSYALFNYYRETDLGGGLSFYHNYIREFFLQERLYEMLESIYSTSENQDKNKKYFYVRDNLLKIFGNGTISDKTIDFLESHSRALQEAGNWCKIENKYKYLQKLITDIILGEKGIEWNENFAFNSWMLKKVVYSVCCKNQENVQSKVYELFDNKRLVISKGNNYLNQYLNILAQYDYIRNINLKEVNLQGKDLIRIGFKGCDFRKSNLSGGVIEHTEFVDCDMRNVKLNGAILKQVLFLNCKLDSGCFRGAIIRESTVHGCSMNECQLQGSRIEKSSFYDSDIENTFLLGTEFIQSTIRDCERIIKNAYKFKYANMQEFQWKDKNMEQEFYIKLSKYNVK